MSNDDDNSQSGASSVGVGRDTILSSEFAAPIRDVLAASADPDFAVPPTEIKATLTDFPDDARRTVVDPVDRASDELFESEETQPSQNLSFPEDRIAALTSDSEPETAEDPLVDQSFEGNLDELQLDEEPLPDPIRDLGAPTLEDPPDDAGTDESPADTWIPQPQDNTPITAFAAAQTEMLQSPFEHDPIVGKLVAVDGPAKGQEFFASALRNTIGRGTMNTIVVGDLAMSREHFEIIRNSDDTFTLVDLGSINGTSLNGTAIREADLFHGDRIDVGQTRFQFIMSPRPATTPQDRHLLRAPSTTPPGVSARRASETPASHRLLMVVGCSALLVSIALFLAVLSLQSERPDGEPASAPNATSHYLRGAEAVKLRDWDLARTEFTRARALDPTLDDVELQLSRITSEEETEETLRQARELHTEGRDVRALEVLAQVPEDSVYHADAADLMRSVRARQVTELYQEAQRALSEGDIDRAQALAADILERAPTHRGALQIRDEHGTSEPRDAGD